MPESATPWGNADGVQPVNATFENMDAGLPVAVTWKVSAVPTRKRVEFALVIVGATPPPVPGLPVVGPPPAGGGTPAPGLAAVGPVVPENWASVALVQSVSMS